MSFRGESKRKILLSDQLSNMTSDNSAWPLQSVWSDGHSTAHMMRLFYKNCPVLAVSGRPAPMTKDQSIPIDMNRRRLVFKIAATLNSMDRTVRGKINIFAQLVEFFRFCDANGLEDIFSINSIQLYVKLLVKNYHAGTKGKTSQQKQNLLKSFIKEFNSDFYLKCKDEFFSFPADSVSVEPYTDNELRDIIYCLETIYKSYSSFIMKGCIPDFFPLETKVLSFIDKNDSGISRQRIIRPVRATANCDQWKYDLSRVAYFITCFYTGVNSSPLLEMKHSDVSSSPFKEVSRGVYKLTTVKGRQGGQVNYIDVGFGRRARDFLQSWLHISKSFLGEENEYVFPEVINGKCSKMTVTEAATINKVFKAIGLPLLSSKRFRKTKASVIMRSTESIFTVAEGLNNAVETASVHYSDGDSVTTEFSLAAALDIRQKTAQGQGLQQAIEQSGYKFKDPIRERFLSKKHLKATSISNGLRCTMPFGEKADQLKKILVQGGLATADEKVACYKFLDCFSCPFHAVIAEVQDIWLLLSFNDVILQALIRPSLNSTPTVVLSKVSNTLRELLERIAKLYPSVYKSAHDKYLDSPHPLWSDEKDLGLLLGVYK